MKRRAFTLVELLVAIGVIAILVSILLPTVNHVRVQADRSKCSANLRSILLAVAVYENDNESYLPWCNWLGPEVAGYRPRGWLYTYPHGATSTATANDATTGVLYSSLNTLQVYRCPDDPVYVGCAPTHRLTSYLFNGAVCGYGRHLPGYRQMKFSSDAILMWEADPISMPWQCGAAYPNQGLAARHNNGGSVGYSDGRVEWMLATDFATAENNLPGPLWCDPGTENGM